MNKTIILVIAVLALAVAIRVTGSFTKGNEAPRGELDFSAGVRA